MKFLKMHFIIIIILFISFFSRTIISQSGIEKNSTVTPSWTKKIDHHVYDSQECGYTNEYVSGSYCSGTSYSNINYGDCSPYTESHIYRSAFKIDIPVPSNGILSYVFLNVNSTFDGEVVELPINIQSYSTSDIFSEIGSASTLCEYTTLSENITDYASDFSAYGYFYVGVKSSNSPADVTIQCTFYWVIPATITFENNFGGGTLYVNSSEEDHGYSDDYWLGDNISLEAIEDQTDSQGYNLIWNDSYPEKQSEWKRNNSYGNVHRSYNKSYNFQATTYDEDAVYTDYLRRECYITFAHEYDNYEDFDIYVDDQQESSPSSNNYVVEGNEIEGKVVNETIDNVQYTFTNWSVGASSVSTNIEQSFYPTQNLTYTANFNAKPIWTNRNLHTNSSSGAYITVYWNEHPCSDVTYKIYRKIRHNGVMGSEVLRATISHGTTQWTDNIQIADGQTTDLVYYDVRAFHTPTSTYSDADYESTVYTWTEQSVKSGDESTNAEIEAEELPTEEENESEIALGNFPNPFNPTTNISYSLAEDGYVSLKVYNILGKEIATLVNESNPAGNYSVSFNASNLPSGVYIYTLQTNGQSFTRKMLLMK